MGSAFVHESVLLEESVGLLAGCRRVLDGTAGAGGHALRLVENGSSVIALDRDPEAVAEAARRLAGRAVVRRLDFSDAPTDEAIRDFRPDGVLLDLGVSSPQLDDTERGFSFRPGARLDMRMAGGGDASAAEWLNTAGQAELAAAFADHGDEPRARRLSREIVKRRSGRPFSVSDDLVNAVRAALGSASGPADFARIFQAVRIVVNDEIGKLERSLPALRELLEPGGVIAVISYHSGEDRVIKHAFRDWARACVCPPEQPVCSCRGRPLGRVLTRRAVSPSPAETARNQRARSARLRAFRKAEP